MGKQTKRQNAKKAIDAVLGLDPEIPNLCCLPHCEEPGDKLECGHALCGMDTLKLTRYVGQLQKFMITCPMCRKLCIFDRDVLMEVMDKHLEFKCATFKCGCVTEGCQRCYSGTLMPCQSHRNYLCTVCVGTKASNLEIHELDDHDPTPPQTERQCEVPDFFHREAWGLTDTQFEQVMAIYKASVGGMSAANERTYRMSRDCHGIPLDFANDVDNIRRHGEDYAPRTHMFKFCDAYLQVSLGIPSILSRASTGQSVR